MTFSSRLNFKRSDFWTQKSFLIRLIKVVTILIAAFSFGIYLSRAADEKLKQFVDQSLYQLRNKTGLQVSVGQVEPSFGKVTLSEVAIGEAAWLVIDKIEVAVSLNPLHDFLHPSSLVIGRMSTKIPWHREQWPKEIQILWNLIEKKSSAAAENNGQDARLTSSLIPNIFSIHAARIEIADGLQPKVLLENMALTGFRSERELQFKSGHVNIMDKVDESFLEGQLFWSAQDSIRLISKSRINFKGEPVWSFDCVWSKDTKYSNCDLDADHLPKSIIQPFQKYLGTLFQPGFNGKIQVGPLESNSSKKSLHAKITGEIRSIQLEHKYLSVNPIGPFSLKVDSSVQFNMASKTFAMEPSRISVVSNSFVENGSKETLPVELQGDGSYVKDGDGFRLSESRVQFDLSDISCQHAIKVLPKDFIPELTDFRLGGQASLHGQVKVHDGVTDFTMGRGAFNCVVLETPELFSSEYLNAPFVIERQSSAGTIRIPVDPARPNFVSYKDIPSLTRQAFVSSEDTGFFVHKGVEMAAIIGAAERNTSAGRAVVGGSTITMQTVKNLYLSRDKTLSRKVQEMFLAWHIERTIPKERILEIYLNMVEFGPDLYGIGPASQMFFGKSPKDLTLKESIYLASLLPAPVPRFRYFCKDELTANYERIVSQLLERMLTLGRISRDQYESASAERIQFSSEKPELYCSPVGNLASDAELGELQQIHN